MTLESAVKRGNNSFDLIRLIAALAVVFSHSFPIFKKQAITDPSTIIGANENAGIIAVYAFFFLSGIFVTASFVFSDNQMSFVIRRGLRIWPGLLVCIFFTVFFVGPVLTTRSLPEYFNDRKTWSFWINNSLIFNTRYYLSGVFETNRYPSAVNGSLWTLPLELVCYLMVLLVGSIFKYRNLLLLLIILCSVVLYKHIFLLYSKQGLCFLTGSCCYLLRRNIIIDGRIFIVSIFLTFAFHNTGLFNYALGLCVIYGILYLGSLKVLQKIKLPGDYSYGIYIYAFTLQQVISLFFPAINPYMGFVVTLPLVIILGALSWHFVERPFIKLAKRY